MENYTNEFRTAVVRWDVPNWWNAVEFWERQLPPDLKGLRALDIGCGEGGISLWLARKNSEVICSDREYPQNHCAELHRKWGVADRICYQAIDATNIPYKGEFDLVAFKSVLGGVGFEGHTGKIAQAMEAIWQALKPGGRLLFAENLDTPFHGYFRRRFVPWGTQWNYLKTEQLLQMMSRFARVEYQTCGFLGTLGRTPAQRTILGKMDRWFVDKMVGSKRHYIMFGVAQKR